MVRGEGYVCPSCATASLVASDMETLKSLIEAFRDRDICFYCGVATEHVEHVIPRRAKLPTYTVLACAECNGLAGGHIFGTFVEKRQYIRDKLAKKHRRVLAMHEWTHDEVSDLGDNLKRWIGGSQVEKSIIESRLAFDICFGQKIVLGFNDDLSCESANPLT